MYFYTLTFCNIRDRQTQKVRLIPIYWNYIIFDMILTFVIASLLNDSTAVNNVLTLLASERDDVAISEQLVDIFGYERIDYAQETLAKRKSINSEYLMQSLESNSNVDEVPTTIDGKLLSIYAFICFQIYNFYVLLLPLGKILDLKALDARNSVQKSNAKPLRPAVQQPSQYPYVFTSHKSTEVVSVYDNKYVLSEDTERIENEVRILRTDVILDISNLRYSDSDMIRRTKKLLYLHQKLSLC